MDHGKLKSLVHWINSVGVGVCVESLQQLTDGTHFISIVKIINGNSGTQFCDQPVQRFRLICSFLEDFYRISLQHHVDHTKILQCADISELAKVAALLLCAAVQGSKVDFFVDAITKLDITVQTHLKEIIEAIVAKAGGKEGLHTNFASILFKKLNEDICTSSPVEPCTPLTVGYRTPRSMDMSPVKAFFNTPHMVSKLKDRQMYDKTRKMEAVIANEKAMRADLEAELVQRNSSIQDKDAKIKELNQNVAKLQRQCANVDNLNTAQSQLAMSQAHIARLEKRLSELESLRSDNTQLEKQVERLYNDNTELEIQVRGHNALKANNTSLKSQLAERVQQFDALRDVGARLKTQLDVAIAAKTETEATLRQQEEMNAEQKRRVNDLEEKQLGSRVVGETMNIVPERSLIVVQNELKMLRSSWIQPAVHQEVVSQLARTSEEMKKKEQAFLEDKRESERKLEAVKTALQENVKLLDGHVHDQTKAVDDLKTTIEGLQSSENRLNFDLLSARDLLSQQNDTISDLKASKMSLEEDVRSRDAQMQQLSDLIQQLQAQVVELRSSEELLKTQIAAAEDLRKQQEGRVLSDVKVAQLQAEQRAIIISKLESESEAQEEEMTTMKAHLQRYAENVQELEAVVKILESTESRLSEELQAACLHGNSREEKFKEEMEEVGKTMELLRMREQELSQEVATSQLHGKRQDQTIASLESLKRQQEGELAAAKREITHHQDVIKELQQSKQELMKRVSNANSEAIQLLDYAKKNHSSDASIATETIRLHLQTIEDLEASRSRLENEMETTRGNYWTQVDRNTELERESHRLNDIIAGLRVQGKDEAAATDERIEIQARAIEELQAMKETLLGEIKNVRHLADQQAETAASSLQAERQKHQESSTKLRQELNAAQTNKEHLAREMTSLEKTNRRQTDMLAQRSDEVAAITRQLEQHVVTISDLEEKLSLDKGNLRVVADAASLKHCALQDDLAKQYSNVKQLQHQLDEALIAAASKDKDFKGLELQMNKIKRSYKEHVTSLELEAGEKFQNLKSRMRFEKDSYEREMQLLREELDNTQQRTLDEYQKSDSLETHALDPPGADLSMQSLDSLNDGELDLAELDTTPQAPDLSIRSNDSGKSTYTIKIHSRLSKHSLSSSTKTCTSTTSGSGLTNSQLHSSFHGNLSDSLDLSHLGPLCPLSLSQVSGGGGGGGATDPAVNLPEKVSQTITELSTDQFKTRTLRNSMRQSKISHKTTGRAGFFLVSSCEEEPEAFDWTRLSELQRRNTLCRPHLQTSYPVETQTRPPKEITEKDLKTGATTGEGTGTFHCTRKRKSGELEPPKDSMPAKMRISNSRQSMLPPMPPPEPKNSTKRSASSQQSTNKKQEIKSKAHHGSNNSISSTSTTDSSVSASTTKGTSKNRFQRAGILRASTKTNTSKKPTVNPSPKEVDKSRQSMAFSIGFSPKPQGRRRSGRLSLSKKPAANPMLQLNAATPAGVTPSKKGRRALCNVGSTLSARLDVSCP